MNFFVVLILTVTVSSGCAGLLPNIFKDIPWTQNINAKLCEAGNHPDSVAQAFYACYQDPSKVPGGDIFIGCQQQVFGALLNTEAGVDAVCAQKDKLSQYALCIFTKLPTRGVCPTTAVHKLNQCQGAVLGVPSP